MTSITVNDVAYTLDVIRFPNNATDFIASTPTDVLGVFSMQLMPGQDHPTFIVGQAIPEGAESIFEGISTRIVNGQTYAVNCVYQLNLCERADDAVPVVLDNDIAGKLLLQAVAELSGYKGTVDTLAVLAAGTLTHKIVGAEIHYMVGDVVFSKAPLPKQ